MRVKSLIELISAAVDTKYITDATFPESGGIMLVGPPGSLKTTIIDIATEATPSVLQLSDLNVHQWMQIKDEFISRRYTCLAFPEYEKLYQRHRATAQNVEGVLKAIVSEGYSVGPGGDPRMPRLKARALVVGGITPDCFEQKYNAWQKNGFLRRFLWCLFSVNNPDAIVEAIREWKRINFGKLVYLSANGSIDIAVTEKRSRQLETILASQPGLQGTGYVLAKKTAAVLEYRYGKDNPEYIDTLLDDLAPSFGKNGTVLYLDEF